MGKAEPGSTKHLSNQMKQKGLTRLRWYCQLCAKPCRDENAYKMHCQSPSHVSKALAAGQDFKGTQEQYSQEFLRNFISLLKTSHGEKEISLNKFYQEVIAERHHTHLNATKWHSLTDFAKYLGREGIVRVEEKEDEGFFISWIDDSPEATKRREAIRRKELQEKGDEEREQMYLQAQIKKAQKEAKARGGGDEDVESEDRELKRPEGEKIQLSFGAKPAKQPSESTPASDEAKPVENGNKGDVSEVGTDAAKPSQKEDEGATKESTAELTPGSKGLSLSFGAKAPKSTNVFKQAKNALSGGKKKAVAAEPKKMTEMERIMKEEIERKRAREAGGGPPKKKMRF